MSVKKYCYCENNCRYETMSKEEILAAIANAIATGTVGDCDTGFITTIKTINGSPLKFFVGTQAEYAALTDKENLFAIITNDTTKEGLLTAIKELQTGLKELNNGLFVDGSKKVKKAEIADNDSNEDSIIHTYFKIKRRSSYSGDPTGNSGKGVQFYCNINGAPLLVTWKNSSAAICFGVIWWDASTKTYSVGKTTGTDVGLGNGGTRHCVEITKDINWTSPSSVRGYARIVVESTGSGYDETGTELAIIPLVE